MGAGAGGPKSMTRAFLGEEYVKDLFIPEV